MTEYTEKGIIEIQRQTITQQNYAIGAHAEAISSLKSGYAMLKIIVDRLARENIALNSRIDRVEQAVQDMAESPHIKKLMSKGRFEPLFKPQDSEVV